MSYPVTGFLARFFHHPSPTALLWLKILSVIIGTFILEDVATVLTAIATQTGTIPLLLALSALYAGVIAGDLGLYGLGRAGAQWPFLRRFLTLPRQERTEVWFRQNLVRLVAISRFVPGARLPLYTALGFFRAPFLIFTLTVICATFVWTSLLFLLSLHIGKWLLAHQGNWRWAGLAGFIICIVFIGRCIARFQRMS